MRLDSLVFMSFMLATAIAPMAAGAQGTSANMRAAAAALIAGVDEQRRERLVLAFTDPARTDWNYVPRSRPGLSFADLEARPRALLHGLLKTALSEIGHRKVVNIIELELVLRKLELSGPLFRDPEKYSIVFFGQPSAVAPWGWRFEGHHLSLSFTLRGDRAIPSTPSFFGANPAEVPRGPNKGLRVLAAEEDEARTLLASFDAAQRKVAIVDPRPYGDILTRAAATVSPLEERGLEMRAMNESQRAQLRALIDVYARNFEPALRAARLARVDEGDTNAIRFAWAGPTERNRPHYYRIQGPKFLIEYDASQNDGNHIHTVWRDFDGDFGRDLLREHHSMTNGSPHRH